MNPRQSPLLWLALHFNRADWPFKWEDRCRYFSLQICQWNWKNIILAGCHVLVTASARLHFQIRIVFRQLKADNIVSANIFIYPYCHAWNLSLDIRIESKDGHLCGLSCNLHSPGSQIAFTSQPDIAADNNRLALAKEENAHPFGQAVFPFLTYISVPDKKGDQKGSSAQQRLHTNPPTDPGGRTHRGDCSLILEKHGRSQKHAGYILNDSNYHLH